MTPFALLMAIAGCWFAVFRIEAYLKRRAANRWWARNRSRIVSATRDRRPLDIEPALRREC